MFNSSGGDKKLKAMEEFKRNNKSTIRPGAALCLIHNVLDVQFDWGYMSYCLGCMPQPIATVVAGSGLVPARSARTASAA